MNDDGDLPRVKWTVVVTAQCPLGRQPRRRLTGRLEYPVPTTCPRHFQGTSPVLFFILFPRDLWNSGDDACVEGARPPLRARFSSTHTAWAPEAKKTNYKCPTRVPFHPSIPSSDLPPSCRVRDAVTVLVLRPRSDPPRSPPLSPCWPLLCSALLGRERWGQAAVARLPVGWRRCRLSVRSFRGYVGSISSARGLFTCP